MIGTTFSEGLELFEKDDQTSAAVLFANRGVVWRRMPQISFAREVSQSQWWLMWLDNSWKICPRGFRSDMPAPS